MGVVIMLNGGPVGWTSVLAKTVATSACEAEINTAVLASKVTLRVQRLLSGFKIAPENRPATIEEGNYSAAIALAQSGLRHVRNAKHCSTRLSFLRKVLVEKHVYFEYFPTESQLADLFTKPLGVTKLMRCWDL